MTTVINNPGNSNNDSSGVGMIIGVIVLIIVAALFIIYVLPRLRNSGAPPQNGYNVNITVPSGGNNNNSSPAY